jgi:hypothetical protein
MVCGWQYSRIRRRFQTGLSGGCCRAYVAIQAPDDAEVRKILTELMNGLTPQTAALRYKCLHPSLDQQGGRQHEAQPGSSLFFRRPQPNHELTGFKKSRQPSSVTYHRSDK